MCQALILAIFYVKDPESGNYLHFTVMKTKVKLSMITEMVEGLNHKV